MGCAKLSVTVPETLYNKAREVAKQQHLKLSQLVAEALSEKLARLNREEYINRVNTVYGDPEIAAEQRDMAEAIAADTAVDELPW
jgi:metal-responsive CopG/Arc/MetJ family transcriptional regulator